MSARELAEMFTPSAGEVEWAREKTQDDQPLLALLVWLKAYQRLGYFPKLTDVPAVVAEHIRGVVVLPKGTTLTEAAERSASGTGASYAPGWASPTTRPVCGPWPPRRSARRRRRRTTPPT
ncbi:DUF4158 domain-containing protein [Streptosporangium canum]|uniref:DUF4158 domain-containing protein n=1 Tax=Streptosporangium canum TaxID=324952 RepID=UPI0036C3D198